MPKPTYLSSWIFFLVHVFHFPEKVAKARQRLSSMKHSHRIFQFQAILMLLLLLGLVGITIYKLMDVNHKPQPWNIDHIYIYAYCAAKRMIEQL